jgi:hypothetical protein
MDLYRVAAVTGFSIVIAAVIGLVRFRQSAKAYRPFFYVVWLGLLNHSFSLLSVYYFRTNAVNGNIFVLAEAMLYIWLFGNWGTFRGRKRVGAGLLILLVLAWVTDNLLVHTLWSANAGFRIITAFVMIFLAIEQLTKHISNIRQSLLRHPVFVICSGLLIYFSYKAFIEVFFLVETDGSLTFMYHIYTIMVCVNCFVNLTFAWAILWIPKKNQSLF